MQAHPIGDLIKLLNKTNKAETKSRLRQFFYKLNESDLYKEFILEGLN